MAEAREKRKTVRRNARKRRCHKAGERNLRNVRPVKPSEAEGKPEANETQGNVGFCNHDIRGNQAKWGLQWRRVDGSTWPR